MKVLFKRCADLVSGPLAHFPAVCFSSWHFLSSVAAGPACLLCGPLPEIAPHQLAPRSKAADGLAT